LLDYGANPDEANAEGHNALKCPCEYDSFPIARMLLDAKANVNLVGKNFTGTTSCALHIAAKNGLDDIVTILLEDGADPTMRNGRHQLPCDIAEGKRHMSTLKIIKAATEKKAKGEASQPWV